MGEPSLKKRKVTTAPQGPVIEDSRFAKFHSDPRYRLPGKKHHVKLDKRFAGILKDEDFSRRAKVDRYGRPVDTESEKNRLKRRYEFEDDKDVLADDDEEVQHELLRVEKHDPLRHGRESASSSDESSSDDESVADEEENILLPEAQGDQIPTGEVTSRLAVVNLDWDNIRATDLMAVFSSFLPATGRLSKVSVYPSDFGKERIEREEMEGPPKDIFKGEEDVHSVSAAREDQEEDEMIKADITKPDQGEEFNSAKLRQYQLERLRYYFAILEFSSPSAAKAIYDAADGTEYLSTANFFDLRFVPDGTEFTNDVARDACSRVPEGYKPNDFVTHALQHSKVKLTWDAEDVTRKEAQARAFGGSRKDIDENDLKAYLGTDSSEDDEGDEDEESTKKDEERQKMRALLGLPEEPTRKSKQEDKEKPVGDLQITFSSGLSGDKEKKGSVFENSYEDANETTLEKYVRKERERKQQRKSKMKGTLAPAPEIETAEDAGFEDPFFAEPTNDKVSTSKLRKEERLKKRAEREADDKAAAAKRAELELLLVDDKETNMRHFDMNEIEKAEKRAKKNKKRKNKKNEGQNQPTVDNFDVDTQDPRFARLYENHEFAIDPTNPRFKDTKGMKKLLDEARARRKNKDETRSAEVIANNTQRISAANELGGSDLSIKKLVEKVKKKR